MFLSDPVEAYPVDLKELVDDTNETAVGYYFYVRCRELFSCMLREHAIEAHCICGSSITHTTSE